MSRNYIPINRKLFKHHFWTEERTYSKAEAWLDLLQQARFDASQGKMLIGNKIVKWNRGQLIASLRFLAQRWNWSTKKVSTYFELLTIEGMAKKETQRETGQSLITICNYDDYNSVNEKKKQVEQLEGNTKETAWKQEGNKTNIDNKEEIINTECNNAPDLKNSNLFRKANVPTFEDVHMKFKQNGGTEEMAREFFDCNEATEWFYRGSPIKNYLPLAQKFIKNWKHKKNVNGSYTNHSKPNFTDKTNERNVYYEQLGKNSTQCEG